MNSAQNASKTTNKHGENPQSIFNSQCEFNSKYTFNWHKTSKRHDILSWHQIDSTHFIDETQWTGLKMLPKTICKSDSQTNVMHLTHTICQTDSTVYSGKSMIINFYGRDIAGKVDSILYKTFFAALSSKMSKRSKMYDPWSMVRS